MIACDRRRARARRGGTPSHRRQAVADRTPRPTAVIPIGIEQVACARSSERIAMLSQQSPIQNLQSKMVSNPLCLGVFVVRSFTTKAQRHKDWETTLSYRLELNKSHMHAHQSALPCCRSNLQSKIYNLKWYHTLCVFVSLWFDHSPQRHKDTKIGRQRYHTNRN